MIRDAFRAVLVIAVIATAAGIVIETRERLVVIDHASRMMAGHAAHAHAPAHAYAAPAQPDGRLRTLGRAAINLADAALGVVR